MQFVLRPVSLLSVVLVGVCVLIWPGRCDAITAPELRGQRAVQEITADMHGLDLKEKEFLKADLREVNLSDTDLRGAVINTSQLQGADLRGADLSDVVGFAAGSMGLTCGTPISPTRCSCRAASLMLRSRGPISPMR